MDEGPDGLSHHRRRRAGLPGVFARHAGENAHLKQVTLIVDPHHDYRLIRLDLPPGPELFFVADVGEDEIVALTNLFLGQCVQIGKEIDGMKFLQGPLQQFMPQRTVDADQPQQESLI